MDAPDGGWAADYSGLHRSGWRAEYATQRSLDVDSARTAFQMRIGKLGLECPDRFITVVEFVAVKAPRSHKDQQGSAVIW